MHHAAFLPQGGYYKLKTLESSSTLLLDFHGQGDGLSDSIHCIGLSEGKLSSNPPSHDAASANSPESSKAHVAGRFAFLAVIGAVYIGWFFMDLPTGIDMQFGGVAALGLIVLYAYVIKPIVPKRLSKILVFIGTVSLEVYLVHTVIIRVLDSNDVPTIWFVAQFVLLPLSSVLIAKLASWVSERILKAADRLNRKSKA